MGYWYELVERSSSSYEIGLPRSILTSRSNRTRWGEYWFRLPILRLERQRNRELNITNNVFWQMMLIGFLLCSFPVSVFARGINQATEDFIAEMFADNIPKSELA
jgi:hypothetical protein